MTDTEKKPYHPPFKRIHITDRGGEVIQQLQNAFEEFWRKVSKTADSCPEKHYASKAIQEACMWLSRATAMKHHKPKKAEIKIIIDDPLAKAVDSIPTTGFSTVNFRGLGDLKEGQVIKNHPRIVVKKKKL